MTLTASAPPDPDAIRLAELSQKLKLPRRWLDLAMAVAVEPDVPQVEHARRLGQGGKHPDVHASKVLNDPRMVEYMVELRKVVNAKRGAKVEAVVEEKLQVAQSSRAIALAEDAQRIQWDIATLGEVLQTLTLQMRFRLQDYVDERGEPDWQKVREAPAGVFRGLEVITTTSEEGQVTTRYRLIAESPQSAAKELRAHHVGIPPQPPPGLTVNILRNLSDDDLDVIERRMTLARERAAIPAEAKHVE
jgi:hypothetical protein